MAVSSISASGSYSLSLVSLLNDETDGTTDAAVSSKSSKAASAYGGGIMSTQGQKALAKALAALKAEGHDRISFAMVEEYRQKQEELFSAEVRKDLLALGVDPNIDFKLVANTDGTVSVVTKSPDKAKIEKYLKDNPEMVEKFQHIQALNNLKRATESTGAANLAAMRDVRKQLQAQAIESFFAASENSGSGFASQIADFSSDGSQASYLLGLNYTV